MIKLICILELIVLTSFTSSRKVRSEPHFGNSTKIESRLSNLASTVVTDLNGRPVPSLTASLTVGKGGSVLLQDTNLINHLAHFHREKIPERIVHTKGTGAHGYFEVTHNISQYTSAELFSKIGSRTNVFVRFSTFGGDSGSADTLRAPRGFATKFYTNDGNWDLVGNNIIVFPIRDPILFPSLVRSGARNPRSHLRDRNAFWDFISLRPESTHNTLQIFSDLGNPDGYRYMNGGGVHTFKLVNASGEAVYCKFLWRSEQGVRTLTREREAELAGIDPDYSIRDLYTAIDRGDFPSWKMFIQVMTFEQAANWRWNPFDITKLWLESEFPPIPVGRLVLNRNPADYFTETESVAFDPGNLVPGIEQSPDPMFHGRAFSYTDSQRYRLGVNFQKLPINRPHAPVNSFERDGICAVDNGNGQPNYFPNSLNNFVIHPRGAESVFRLNGDVVRKDTGDEDNFSQAKIFLDSLGDRERERLVADIAFDLMNVTRPGVLARTLANFRLVDVDFVDSLEAKIQEYLLK